MPLVAVLVGVFVWYFQNSYFIAGFCAMATSVLFWIALRVEEVGLVGLMPPCVGRAMYGSLFDLLAAVINSVAVFSCNLLRLVMLACMDLTPEQRVEILTDMDPAFRRYVFQQPVVSLFPLPLQRLILGRAAGGKAARRNGEAAAEEDEAQAEPSRPVRMLSTVSNGSVDDAGQRRRSTTDNLMDIVRGIDAVARNSEGATNISRLENILAEKTLGRRVMQARYVLNGAQTKAYETFEYSREKVSKVVNDPRTQSSASCAVDAAWTYGATGARRLGVVGGAIGGLCGLVPAVFTFGLSIPIGVAVGGTIGGLTGAGVGSGAGFVGGAAYGFTHLEGAKDQSSLPPAGPEPAGEAAAPGPQ